MAGANKHGFARGVFFLCVALQVPLLPLLPLGEGGDVDSDAKPEWVSSLQVVMGVMLKQLEHDNPEVLLLMAAPGALAREAVNMASCELGLEGCVEGRLYDWSALAQHPDFRPSALQPRIVATYPDKLKEVFAGCLITSVSALLCLYTANKLALVGVGISVHATMSQGLKLAPWVGIVVSAALFVGGLVDVKPEARAAPADPPADPPAAAEPKKEK